jgi:tripartite-type tricarboxylate transporter receptor subunit TctC
VLRKFPMLRPSWSPATPKYKAHTWNGLVAPAGTLKEIIDKVAKLVESAIKDPTLAKKLATYGVDPLGNTPEEV